MRSFAIAVVSCTALVAGLSLANATTCEQAVYKCKTEANRQTDGVARCDAAGAECKKTGQWTGPFTGKTYKISR
ncbi:MAG: hypothetical protein J0I29_11335 [Rhizobiales bacterium]|nr:hypothetical protein [Hyphomicrobiales bacterium]